MNSRPSLDKVDAELDAALQGASTNWKQVQKNLNQGFKEKKASIKADIDAQKKARDAKRTEKRAERAEDEAYAAVQIAIAAIERAEYTVLDAVLARADADELNAR